jgi:hypothetical protein
MNNLCWFHPNKLTSLRSYTICYMNSSAEAEGAAAVAVEAEESSGMALELLELALLMSGERHRREFPEATDEEVAHVVQAWKVERPGAPNGDAIGRSVPWPRR